MGIDEYLKSTPKLAQLCSQNGWIDNETLRYELMEQADNHAIVNVTFDEVVMEGSGCVADRVSCYGKIRLVLNPSGQIENSEFI